MADQNQPQGPRGVPGAPPPPVPTPEQIQQVVARQKQEQAEMVARHRAAMASMNNDQQGNQSSAHFQSQNFQPQTFQSQNFEQGHMNSNDSFSSIPTQQEKVNKEEISWWPMRSGKGNVSIELYESIIKNFPQNKLKAESDPQAKVVMALLLEVLYLNHRIETLERRPSPNGTEGMAEALASALNRIGRLEQTMFNQKVDVQVAAKTFKQQVQELQSQGASPEDILAKLTGSEASE